LKYTLIRIPSFFVLVSLIVGYSSRININLSVIVPSHSAFENNATVLSTLCLDPKDRICAIVPSAQSQPCNNPLLAAMTPKSLSSPASEESRSLAKLVEEQVGVRQQLQKLINEQQSKEHRDAKKFHKLELKLDSHSSKIRENKLMIIDSGA
jgi:hypothetical protein